MARLSSKKNAQTLNREVKDSWNRNATWWDAKVGEGNQFQKILIGPATERLLKVHPGETVLDIACGNGSFSRRLAKLGARVVAFDFSKKFIDLAKSHTADTGLIEYKVVDATDEVKLMKLGKERFDAAVCTMALMDMANIRPLMKSLGKLLKRDGRFVFSVLHPCFNSTGCKMAMEQEDKEGSLVTTYSIKVSRYLSQSPAKGVGIEGQPVPQLYFHRTLSSLLSAGFAAGFVLDGIEEPGFAKDTTGKTPLAWANFKEIPPVLLVRMHLWKG